MGNSVAGTVNKASLWDANRELLVEALPAQKTGGLFSFRWFQQLILAAPAVVSDGGYSPGISLALGRQHRRDLILAYPAR
jgi:hypothetical protein